eukprot:scaffold19099_cov71-Phaeocystis_antarctica.AAC.5
MEPTPLPSVARASSGDPRGGPQQLLERDPGAGRGIRRCRNGAMTRLTAALPMNALPNHLVSSPSQGASRTAMAAPHTAIQAV